ncbi:GNAT family N-acetyltransferase [Oceanobacillus bengalensis]|uniref:N-acetyltransferase domain-containing protein n=1 Tax=Oceanobacillus bengalensis TaxID=1435466 RepID=A0A494Z9D7_9BACI|nr:GNAT family N-acetyltransferase [Oceanobacillus bengalensis]RKQ18679.1 hypothetical protein D8M05_00780 [Oceanobacillus bengalensis]
MQIIIRNEEQQDEEQLKRLIRMSCEESFLINILKSKHLVNKLTAFEGKRLVGALIAWKSTFHPHCIYLRIVIDPFYYNENIPKRLLDELSIDRQLPLQTSIWDTNIALREFYEANGFKYIRKTCMPTLSLSRVTEMEQQVANVINNIEGKIVTVANILGDKQLKKKLTLLAKDVYQNTHEDNPVAEMGVEAWESLVYPDDLISEGSLICLGVNQEIKAFSMLHKSEDDDTLELGWCGSVDTQTIPLIPELVLQQITYAKELGYQHLQGEFDTTSVYAMEVLKRISFPPSASWHTYQK